jgi:serine/threonine protein kinase
VRVGRYRVLRRIAEGGMGAVYEAEQDSPRRPVALKVVRPGLASPALVKRFTHEAQILGRLHHPGIARVWTVSTLTPQHPARIGVAAPHHLAWGRARDLGRRAATRAFRI